MPSELRGLHARRPWTSSVAEDGLDLSDLHPYTSTKACGTRAARAAIEKGLQSHPILEGRGLVVAKEPAALDGLVTAAASSRPFGTNRRPGHRMTPRSERDKVSHHREASSGTRAARNNTANDNSEARLLLTEDAGPDNSIRGNRARRNRVHDLADFPLGSCTTNVLRDNRGTLRLGGCEAGTR